MSSSEEFVTGSCLCKAVTYKAVGAPMFKTLCHCYNCRKASGAPIMGSSVYLMNQVVFTGKEHIKIHEDSATDSGQPYRRHFCGRCGSQIGGQSATHEQFFAVNQGSLDKEFVNEWEPLAEQYCQTKAGFLPPLVAKGGEHQFTGRYVRHMLGARVEDQAA
ncbi:hypothetical protein K461DRAFT_318630 [Myriangium duriaei CBS 260.36]|uniref:CENP-V/GFA domain-containing protein n=1 Tax=Myriangium duriaei CBS 260.36 TaxID=1168546 RepID=A0A9P4JBV1_9PEZI|nr:hypothetical protein K461DRAFT_318630 [Myriangium duriaei CBS 260.36]